MSDNNNKESSVWEYEDYWPESETFNGKPIVGLNSDNTTDVSEVALLVEEPLERQGWFRLDPISYGEDDQYQHLYDPSIAPAVVKVFHELLHYKDLAAIDTLVLGLWGGRHKDSTDIKDFIGLVLEHAASFSGVKALFIGGDSLEYMDIYDMQLSKMGGLLNAFPQLEVFKTRGAPNAPNQGDRLGYESPPDHLKTFFEEPLHLPNLKSLIIETADMDLQTIENLSKSYLPKLEHLELWFGAFAHIHYEKGEQRKMLVNIKVLLESDLPSLRYLGLRNSYQANKIAMLVADSPILLQLYELDLSLGNISKKGAKALLKSPAIGGLNKLNIYRHAIKKSKICYLLADKIPEVDFRLSPHQGDERCDKNDYNIFMYE